MKTMKTQWLVRMIGVALAMSMAYPVLAQDQDDQKDQKNTQQDEDEGQERAKARKAKARPPHEEPVRQNETFAPSRPDPRALEQREREDAHARNAARQAEQDRARDQEQDRDIQSERQAERRQHVEAARQAQRERDQATRQDEQRRDAVRRDDVLQSYPDQRRIQQRERADVDELERAQPRRTRVDEERLRQIEASPQRPRVDNEGRRQIDMQQRDRLSEQERQRLIDVQQQRAAEYRRYLAARQAAEQERIRVLQQQRRLQQYRYQQLYWERQRALQARWNAQRYSYYDDPYYYTPASYRYLRDGRYYSVNQYAADLLRQAVRYGYDQGVRAGRADRLDGWRSDYRHNFAYLDANYGYNGYYVSQGEYNYYFRQGFRRGYEDGYGRDYRYGRYDDGTYSILAAVLQAILGLQPFG